MKFKIEKHPLGHGWFAYTTNDGGYLHHDGSLNETMRNRNGMLNYFRTRQLARDAVKKFKKNRRVNKHYTKPRRQEFVRFLMTSPHLQFA